MTGRVVATLPGRFAASALIAAICTFGVGCSQLLGITDITAAADASIKDNTGAGGSSNGTAGSDADNGSDGPSTDIVGDRSFNDGETNADAPTCSGDLSNIGTGGFLISFTLRTNQTNNDIALLNQRSECTVVMYWDVRLYMHQIYLELSESTSASGYTRINSSGPPLNDNNPHDVVITRTNDAVQIVIDGTVASSGTAAQSLAVLPALKTGTDVCVGSDGTVALATGGITNVCVRPN